MMRGKESQETHPRVSVGMPVYNSEAFIEETIRAILGQTLADFELIISDNASTDRTAEICREFARTDPRIRYSRNAQNIGVPGNYNAVLTKARAEYFKWCASNDICRPRFLEACVAVLDARPDVVLAYPQTVLFDADRDSYEEYEDNMCLDQDDPVERFRLCCERLRLNNAFNGVIRARELRRTTLHWAYPGSDVALMPELSLYGKFIEIPERLFFRRMESNAHFGRGTAELYRAYYPGCEHGLHTRARGRIRQMLSGVGRAPLGARERFRLYEYVAHHAWGLRRELVGFGGSESREP